MKTLGIVRNLDQLGRITLPKELRRVYGIEVGSPLEIYTEGDSICLRKWDGKSICDLTGYTVEELKAELLNRGIS